MQLGNRLLRLCCLQINSHQQRPEREHGSKDSFVVWSIEYQVLLTSVSCLLSSAPKTQAFSPVATRTQHGSKDSSVVWSIDYQVLLTSVSCLLSSAPKTQAFSIREVYGRVADTAEDTVTYVAPYISGNYNKMKHCVDKMRHNCWVTMYAWHLVMLWCSFEMILL